MLSLARKRIHEVAGHEVRLNGWRAPLRSVNPNYLIISPSMELALPKSFTDMQQHWITIYDQGDLGSCTANGSLELYKFNLWKMGQPVPDFSRLFQYWATRVGIEGSPATEDSGCSVGDALLALSKYGACPESLLPYDTSRFAEEPSAACFAAAKSNLALDTRRLPNLLAIKTSLTNWYPVTFGFTVFSSMMTDAVAKSGVVPVPSATEDAEGGHCVTTLGYDDSRQALLCVNSWGTSWGLGGYFWLPYYFWQYGLASDAHVILRESNVLAAA